MIVGVKPPFRSRWETQYTRTMEHVAGDLLDHVNDNLKQQRIRHFICPEASRIRPCDTCNCVAALSAFILSACLAGDHVNGTFQLDAGWTHQQKTSHPAWQIYYRHACTIVHNQSNRHASGPADRPATRHCAAVRGQCQPTRASMTRPHNTQPIEPPSKKYSQTQTHNKCWTPFASPLMYPVYRSRFYCVTAFRARSLCSLVSLCNTSSRSAGMSESKFNFSSDVGCLNPRTFACSAGLPSSFNAV